MFIIAKKKEGRSPLRSSERVVGVAHPDHLVVRLAKRYTPDKLKYTVLVEREVEGAVGAVARIAEALEAGFIVGAG